MNWYFYVYLKIIIYLTIIVSTLRESISRGYLFFFVKKGHKYVFSLYHLSTLVLTAILTE